MAESPSAPRLTRASLTSAVSYLTRRDRGLAQIVRTDGLPPLWARRPGFATLAQVVLEQQVSLASARAVYGRVAAQLSGGWTTTAVVLDGTTGLMARGITRQKAGYIVALADRIQRGELVLRSLGRTPDSDEAVEWASRWAPYRSVAARILWAGYLGERSARLGLRTS